MLISTSNRYRIPALVVLVILCMVGIAGAQVMQGFYVSIGTMKNCSNRVPALIGSQDYCVSENPIISVAEFEAVSKIKVDPVTDDQTITLRLSPLGLRTWEGLLKNLPNALIVLVIDGYVVGTFKNEGYRVTNVVPIYAPAGSTELQWIRDHLKKVMIVD